MSLSGQDGSFSIVLVAAGTSTRMGFDKVWAELQGVPLLVHTLDAARRAEPAEIVLVVAEQRLSLARRLAPYARIVLGGPRRRDSVAAGVREARSAWVAVHDAARALVKPRLFHDGLAAARCTGAAIPALPLKDTLKQVADGTVAGTLRRDQHVAVQTPQVFRRDLLLEAFDTTDEDVTDEATLLERMGVQVAVFPGHEENFKVTTPFDFELLHFMLARRPEPPRR